MLIAVSISSLLYNTLDFVSNYALNVGYVVAQPLQMARWLAANTPEDARIAVHDVGMMRYIGGRTTIDIVGLTTPDAAAYWRNGPGSVGEFIEKMRPDYIASYGEGHGLGLGYLQHTALYADTLASYTVSLDPVNNVALAAPTQGIYKPNWAPADRAVNVLALPSVSPYLSGMEVVDSIDVADIDSEQAHDYQWRENQPPGGFPTEYYQFDTIGCSAGSAACSAMDGGRLHQRRGVVHAHDDSRQRSDSGDAPASRQCRNVRCLCERSVVGTRVIPALPGAWLEVPTLIPAAIVTDATRIRIVPHVSGDYMPYYHWAYQGNPYQPVTYPGDPLATFEIWRDPSHTSLKSAQK